MHHKIRSREQGFTLIEVLVALVVTSLLLGIVMNAALQARERSVLAHQKTEAVLLAEALVAERIASPFVSQSANGAEDGLTWRIDEAAIARDPRGLFLLSEVRVHVTSAKGASLFDATARKLKQAPVQ